MAVSRADRREERQAKVVDVFGTELAPRVLDLLELMELAWHDCYNEISPSEAIIDDVLLLSNGDLGRVIAVVRDAVMDWRDVRVAADQRRSWAQ
jgi:hypothetical protein